MRSLIAAFTIAAATLGGAAPALASGIAGENCVEVSETQNVNGVEFTTGRQVVCESHDVSPPSISGDGDQMSTSPVDARSLVADVRRHLEEGDVGIGDLYRHIVEDHLGGDVYENTVCDDADPYLESLDCWATDYLLGDYVRNALLGWVDGIIPLPAPARELIESTIDHVVGTTNDPAPGAPVAPELPPAPAIPEPGDLIAMIPGPPPGTPGAPPIDPEDLIREFTDQAAEVGRLVDTLIDQVDEGASDTRQALDQATAAAQEALREARRGAEAALNQALDESGEGPRVERVRRMVEDQLAWTQRYVDERLEFLRRQLGV